ncbi:hypothetical protein GLA29479_3987 [Lysobacter antibioticus]|nr:hypothetical protein GLA29479_3987 [Lysobacter antibioticus]
MSGGVAGASETGRQDTAPAQPRRIAKAGAGQAERRLARRCRAPARLALWY